MHTTLSTTLSQYQHIVLVGGGTGGHIQPIINIIDFLRPANQQTSPHSFLWIGGADSSEQKAAKDAEIDFETIPTLKLTTTKSPKILLYPIVLIRGIMAARKILKKAYADIEGDGGSGGEIVSREMKMEKRGAGRGGASFLTTETFDTFGHKSMVKSDSEIAVFSKGGPGSVAVGIAAWSLGIPLYIHESDTIPGRSNRILGRFATRVFLGFETAKAYFDTKKCETIGQILHPVFSDSHCEPAKQSRKIEITKPLDRFVPRDDENQIHWNTDKTHLLIICGSQGARVIFEEILRHIATIVEKYEVILVLGKLNTDMRADFEKRLEHHVHTSITLLDWIEQESLAHLIRDTDIAITRGSATTLAELTACPPRAHQPKSQRASHPHLIIIPLPHAADNHQYYNALEYQKLGHTLLEQKNISTLIDHF